MIEVSTAGRQGGTIVVKMSRILKVMSFPDKVSPVSGSVSVSMSGSAIPVKMKKPTSENKTK